MVEAPYSNFRSFAAAPSNASFADICKQKTSFQVEK